MAKGKAWLLAWLRRRLSERSTALGLGVLLASCGVSVSPQVLIEVLPVIGAVLVAIPTGKD